MPISAEQLDAWFTYHPPTEEQKPKYAALRVAFAEASLPGVALLNEGTLATHDEVNRRSRALVETIDALVPESADRTAAIRCVRLARNAFNEAIVQARGEDGAQAWLVHDLVTEGNRQLRLARWQANSAIALEGKV
jgi:hypothetical protein